MMVGPVEAESSADLNFESANHFRALSYFLPELPVAANQVVGRTVVLQGWLGLALEFRDNSLREHLAQFYSPLVERVDLPDCALREHGVLVERDQLAENRWRKLLGQDGIRRAIALEHAMWHEPVRSAFRFYLVGCFAKGQRLTLCKDVCEKHVVMLAKWIKRFAEGDEVAGYQSRPLVD